MPSLKDNVERWLTHENYSFKKIESSESNFKFLINNGDALGNNIEIFEPGQQENILVVGIKVEFKTKLIRRFLELSLIHI